MNRFCQSLYMNSYYHIYNRGINGNTLFFCKENYSHFLKKYDYYLIDYLDTFAYCLLPNHFHLFVRVKEKSTSISSVDHLVSEQFRKFFIAYSMAIHKQEHRTGSLFERPFKRLPVTQQSHFNAVLSYIHINPEKHGVVPNFTSYPYSSYQSILSDKPTHLCRNEVVSWFASKMDFIKFHENMKGVHLKDNDDFIDG